MTIKKQGQEKESRRKWRRKSEGEIGGGRDGGERRCRMGSGSRKRWRRKRKRKNKQGRRRIRRLRKGIMGGRNEEEEKRRRNGREDDEKQR